MPVNPQPPAVAARVQSAEVRREVDRVEAERREEQRSRELVGAQNTYMY